MEQPPNSIVPPELSREPQAPEADSGFLSAHLGLIAIGSAAFLILIGAFVVRGYYMTRFPQDAGTTTFGGVPDFFNPTNPSTLQPNTSETPDFSQQLPGGVGVPYTPPSTPQGGTSNGDGSGFDLNAFIKQLTAPKATSGPGVKSVADTLAEAYAFLPSTLISTSSKTTLSPALKALHDYGNAAGGEIQDFEDAHKYMAQVLKDQSESPNDPAANGALEGLANDLTTLGNNLDDVENVPSEAKVAHNAVVKSYRELGAKLLLIPKAVQEADRAHAMLNYDASADQFVKNYISLAGVFSLSNVTFTPNEPGSVFMFSAQGL